MYLLVSFFFGLESWSQNNKPFLKNSSRSGEKENSVTLGIEPSVLFPGNIFNPSSSSVENLNARTSFSQKTLISLKAGISLRYDLFRIKKSALTNQFSLNTGLFYVHRRFNMVITEKNSLQEVIFDASEKLNFVSYEIPLTLQIQIRASETIWLNAGMGMGLEFFPSHAYVPDDALQNPDQEGYWVCYMARKNLFVPGFKMFFGTERRTVKIGYFYLGLAFHQPIPAVAQAYWRYNRSGQSIHPYPDQEHFFGNPDIPVRIVGNYFALEFKYFFRPSKPSRSLVAP